jgi:cytochrome b6-f complex iron-sulfur subunit
MSSPDDPKAKDSAPAQPVVQPTPEQAAKIAELKNKPAVPVTLAPHPSEKDAATRKMGQLTQPDAKPGGPAPETAGFTRRSFVTGATFTLGWGAFAVLLASSGAAMQRFLYPNVLFEPPLKFHAGYPTDYVAGKVDERFKAKYGVWIVRTDDGLYALSTICTHLGCTPNWLEAEDKFKCPCHGSGYHKDGVNFEGPTPRPLERYAISLTDSGEIEIDKSRKFRWEQGDWEKPESFLKFKG